MTNRLPYTTTGGTFSADHTFAQLLEYLRMSEEAAYVLGHYYKAQDDWHKGQGFLAVGEMFKKLQLTVTELATKATGISMGYRQ